jgi:hypothetical protein
MKTWWPWRRKNTVQSLFDGRAAQESAAICRESDAAVLRLYA